VSWTGPVITSFNGPNAADVFAVSAKDFLIYHRYLDGKGVWQPADWESLGSPTETPQQFMGVRPAVASQSSSEFKSVFVYAVGQDNKMYTKSWYGKAWQPAKTAPWDALGGAYMGPTAAVSVNDVDLVYFAVGTDNEMHQVSTTNSYGTGSLGGKFASLPAAFFGGYCDGPIPRLLCNIFVLGTGTDSQVYCTGALLGGMASVAYWRALSETPLLFGKRQPVPDHWRTLGTRHSTITGTPRGAVTPGNALLNYLYSVLASEITIALHAAGLDPALGIFHADKDDRASLAYDLMEPARPVLDRWFLQWIGEITFSKRDFHEDMTGISGFCIR